MLVQVGHQQILLGVGPEGMTCLTTLTSQAPNNSAATFAGHLASANPNATVKLKNTNEVIQQAQRPTAERRSQQQPSKPATKPRVQVEIGDDDLPGLLPQNARTASDDLTKVIRDRLRGLASS
jgi:hypothetical protein